ncbi:Uncharacterised protein [Cedecea lapagei]|uniref:Uncharacterized protein n=1 Tax=Cedecea lapagei TaxID=158823 RepID=A0A447UX62_9ENTR|nr:Uncharacterised protein [Cedecea lapagei]
MTCCKGSQDSISLKWERSRNRAKITKSRSGAVLLQVTWDDDLPQLLALRDLADQL